MPLAGGEFGIVFSSLYGNHLHVAGHHTLIWYVSLLCMSSIFISLGFIVVVLAKMDALVLEANKNRVCIKFITFMINAPLYENVSQMHFFMHFINQ